MNRIFIVSAMTVLALVFAATAQADWTFTGSAKGITMQMGDGTYKILGTYTDPYAPNGFGHYSGTYTAQGDFTSCVNIFFCRDPTSALSHCNGASGEVTFQSGVRLVTVFISSNPSATVFVPGLCQLPDTTTRVPYLKLFNQWLPDESSRGLWAPVCGFRFDVGHVNTDRERDLRG
jgi:hypothetical protein